MYDKNLGSIEKYDSDVIYKNIVMHVIDKMPREETLYDLAELCIIFFGGIGGTSKRGILVKGGNYLEALNNVEVVVFDKTVYTRFFELYITC